MTSLVADGVAYACARATATGGGYTPVPDANAPAATHNGDASPTKRAASHEAVHSCKQKTKVVLSPTQGRLLEADSEDEDLVE